MAYRPAKGIERMVAEFRADPHEADATPMNVIAVADEAQSRIALLNAAVTRALNWSDRQPAQGLKLPPDVERALRAALVTATA